MVTEAGKELLRNTINTAKFHNRILEENEMWKQFELERGLTMMVSDDLFLKKINKKNHLCRKHRKEKSEPQEIPERKEISSTAGSSRDFDRWDHSGFHELYPEEITTVKKWDHSGFLELYPEEAEKLKSKKTTQSKELSKECTKSKWDHGGFLELYPEEAEKLKSKKTTQSKELSKECTKSKEKKKKGKPIEVSSSDTEIWEEFKMYKRKKVLTKTREKTDKDSHVKDWKRRMKDKGSHS